MLRDEFTGHWLDVLSQRAKELPPSREMHLLLDGAFVPGLHRRLPEERKALLFATLPGCTEEVEDASPFLTRFTPDDKALKSLLRRCNRWPMVSAIETSESLAQLANRLSAWCVVDADGQRFNFRFPDSRRLPAIFRTLDPKQRTQIAGPAVRWSYVARDGVWREIEIVESNIQPAEAPALNAHQFASLVDDSQTDEFLIRLCDRGHDVFHRPSRSHTLVASALCAAGLAKLGEDDLLDWCEWFWKQDRLHDAAATAALLKTWRIASL